MCMDVQSVWPAMAMFKWNIFRVTVYSEFKGTPTRIIRSNMCVVPTGNPSSAWLLFGAEDAEPSQPLSGCHIWHNAFFSNSNLFKIQPLQFAVRIWQYFHSRELQSCQKADKRKRNNTPADIEMIFHEFIPH